jgi:hypothetical protein
MLYMCEIDPTNIELSKKLLLKMCGGGVDCKLNVIEGDFITLTYDEIKTKFGGIEKFNVCMGNPPYNPPKTETGSSGNSIWPNFVMKMESMLEPNGYICLVHPPGWKKPTDKSYRSEDFKNGNYGKIKDKKGEEHRIQIRQGQVWQYLRDRGTFTFIYTNDQRTKAPEYWPNFPAVDYYVFQSGNLSLQSNTRNIFYGGEYSATNVNIPNTLTYLPCIITQETISILEKLTSKEGRKLNFKPGIDPRSFKDKTKEGFKYIYDASAKGPNYAYYAEKGDNVDKSKIVINETGGIDGYYAKFINASDNIGVLHHTMYQLIESPEDGQNIERFLNSVVVRFAFLITQYTFGKMTRNEKGVANSIAVPPNDVTDYYEFFELQEYKPFIEKLMNDYKTFKTPKSKGGDNRSSTPRKRSPVRKTIRRVLVDDE